jgi:hypothetical protein
MRQTWKHVAVSLVLMVLVSASSLVLAKRRLHVLRLAPTRARAAHRPVSKRGESYKQAIRYTRRRLSFTPRRTVRVTNASQLKHAISNLRPGTLVHAARRFAVSGETVIRNRLSSPAELDLRGVSFIYRGSEDRPAVWLSNAKNIRIFGGDASTADSGGACIVDYGSQDVTWWGFTAHDCGGVGFAAAAIGGPVDHNDFQGTIWKVGQHLAWDNHQEKGSGLHGANLFDQPTTLAFTNNRFAFDMHDIPTGACVEFGNDQVAPAGGNVLYLRCVNASFVSTLQTGGNALQLWGDTNTIGLDIKYLEGDNLQGYALFTHVYPGQTCHGVTVEQGRASNTNLNPRYAGKSPWDTTHGIVYQDVRPSP